MLGMDVVEKTGFRKEKGSFMGSVSHWTDIDRQGYNASHKRKKKKGDFCEFAWACQDMCI